MAQMNFMQTLDALLFYPIKKSILISSNHGMGKDAVIWMAAKIKSMLIGKQVQVVDIRFSQKDIGDITGMPFLVDGRSFNAPPIWFPLDESSKKLLHSLTTKIGEIESGMHGEFGYLFLNELTYATKELQQAGFELILDRGLGIYKVPPGWRVVSAANTNTKIYRVPHLGPALLSRFADIEFRPSAEEWLNYAYGNEVEDKYSELTPEQQDTWLNGVPSTQIHQAVIGFIQKDPSLLDPSDEVILENDGKKLYDRRSWESLSQTIQAYEEYYKQGIRPTNIMDKNDLNDLYRVASSFVGSMVAGKFMTYVQIEYKSLDADAILNRWGKATEDQIRALVKTGERVHELSEYNDQLVDYIKNVTKKNLTTKQGQNLINFLKVLPNELVVRFWKHFEIEAREQARAWFNDPSLNREPSKIIMSAMEIPKGLKKAKYDNNVVEVAPTTITI